MSGFALAGCRPAAADPRGTAVEEKPIKVATAAVASRTAPRFLALTGSAGPQSESRCRGGRERQGLANFRRARIVRDQGLRARERRRPFGRDFAQRSGCPGARARGAERPSDERLRSHRATLSRWLGLQGRARPAALAMRGHRVVQKSSRRAGTDGRQDLGRLDHPRPLRGHRRRALGDRGRIRAPRHPRRHAGRHRQAAGSSSPCKSRRYNVHQ